MNAVAITAVDVTEETRQGLPGMRACCQCGATYWYSPAGVRLFALGRFVLEHMDHRRAER